MNHQSLSADLSPCPNPAPLPLQGRVDLCPSTAGNRRPTPHPVFNLQGTSGGDVFGAEKINFNPPNITRLMPFHSGITVPTLRVSETRQINLSAWRRITLRRQGRTCNFTFARNRKTDCGSCRSSQEQESLPERRIFQIIFGNHNPSPGQRRRNWEHRSLAACR